MLVTLVQILVFLKCMERVNKDPLIAKLVLNKNEFFFAGPLFGPEGAMLILERLVLKSAQ